MLTPFVFFEERAAAIHLAVPRLDWFHTNQVELLHHWLFPLLQVEQAPVLQPMWCPLANGCSKVLVPKDLQPYFRRKRTWHEVGHLLVDVGLSHLADSADPEERKRFPLVGEAERREEELIANLVDAIQMPAPLVGKHKTLEEIARQTGFPFGVIARRLRTMRGQVFRLNYLPAWSAARFYRLEFHPAGTADDSHSLLLFRQSEVSPDFRIPVTNDDLDERVMRLKADLLALRAKELAGKYGYFAVREPVRRSPHACVLGVDLDELRAWAREMTGPEADDG